MLVIRDLCIVFNPSYPNEKVVLEHFVLSIESGQIVSLVGESGSGKTMVSLAILGLLPEIPKLVQGQIFWNEIDLLSSSEADLCKIRGNEIAMIFQEPMSAMNPLMRIKDQLDEAITIHQKEIPFCERKKKITKAPHTGFFSASNIRGTIAAHYDRDGLAKWTSTPHSR